MIVVTSRLLCHRPFLEQLELIASARPELIILREKDLPHEDYTALTIECKRIAERYDVRLSVNSDVDAARELGIDAIHLPMSLLRRTETSDFDLVGASIHSVDEAMEAESLGADYVIAGHIFTTACKTSEPRGPGFIGDICSSVDIPVYAIGGIDHTNVGCVLEQGAHGIAVMSSAMTSDDPRSLIESYRIHIL